MNVQHLQHLPAAAYCCNERNLVAVIEGRRIELYESAGRHSRRIVSAQGNDLERTIDCEEHTLRRASLAHRRPEGNLVGAVE